MFQFLCWFDFCCIPVSFILFSYLDSASFRIPSLSYLIRAQFLSIASNTNLHPTLFLHISSALPVCPLPRFLHLLLQCHCLCDTAETTLVTVDLPQQLLIKELMHIQNDAHHTHMWRYGTYAELLRNLNLPTYYLFSAIFNSNYNKIL